MRVHEIYRSLQGETTRAGLPVAVVRLSGCNLHCRWCDTPKSHAGGDEMAVSEVLDALDALGVVDHVLLTGGEPLLQREQVVQLAGLLLARGETVLIETNGSQDIEGLDPRIVRIVDLKAPGSGEATRMRAGNLSALRPRDELKMVLANRADYEWARRQLDALREAGRARCTVLLSPAYGLLEARTLAKWIVEDRLGARLQVQLHKILWGADVEGV